MKGTVVLILLGAIGLGQYAYFQATPLGYNYEYYTYRLPDVPYDMIGVNVVRDWTVGIVGAVVGAILLGLGIYRYRHRKAQA